MSWKPDDVIAWRGIYREQVWDAIPAFVVHDSLQELVLALIPGTVCMMEENYISGRKNGKRRWDFMDEAWKLAPFTWHTHRLLFILEPEKYYSTIFFWNDEKHSFVGYYVNFQLPFRRNHCGVDTLDLELDLDIHPDFSFRWKDVDDYEKGIETGIILPEWVNEIESAKVEILERLAKRQYPFEGSWLDWVPDPNWVPPPLPENWDKI